MAAFIPLVAAGVSAISQHNAGEDADRQDNTQAMLNKAEGQQAEQVSATQEATQRRQSREFLGRQAAAFAQAGVGPGSSTDVMRQSAVDAELDAMNIRYRGALTKFGYDYNSQAAIEEGRAQKKNANLMAGATLLKGVSNYYNG